MFNDVYETTPCSSYNMGKVRVGIAHARLHGDTYAPQSIRFGEVNELELLTSKDKETPIFAHPFANEFNGEKRITIDGRSSTRIDKATGNVVVTSSTEYEFLILQGLMQYFWMEGEIQPFLATGPLAPKVFTRWISDGITRRLNLTSLEQLQIAVVAGLYYYQLFGNDLKQESTKLKVVGQVARTVMVGADKVFAIADKLPPMTNIAGLINGIKIAVESPRIDMLSPVLLYAILGGSWFGANAREIVAISLEFPPTFLSMIYESLENRAYHRSFFAELVAVNSKKDIGKHFVNAINHLLKK